MSSFTKVTLDNIAALNDCANEVAQWHAWAVETNKTLMTGKTDLEKTTSSYERKKGSCNTTQGNLENRFCDYTSGLSEGCTTHSTCLSKRGREKDAVDKDVRVAENARKHQYVSAVHIICYVEVILLDNSTVKKQKMQQCGSLNANASSAAHLDIVYPQAPTPSTCDLAPIASPPCSANWINQRYQAKGWFTKVQNDPCIACPSTDTAAAAEAIPITYEENGDVTSGWPDGETPQVAASNPWFSIGCGSTDPCANDHVYSPFVLSLPTTERSGHRWWTGSGCSAGNCDNVWTVFDLHASASVQKIRFLNYQNTYGAKSITISYSQSLSGSYTTAQSFDEIPSSGAGNLGTNRNHCCDIPDEELVFTAPFVGRYVKLEITKNHGAGGTGFYRAFFFTGSVTQAATAAAAEATPITYAENGDVK